MSLTGLLDEDIDIAQQDVVPDDLFDVIEQCRATDQGKDPVPYRQPAVIIAINLIRRPVMNPGKLCSQAVVAGFLLESLIRAEYL